MLLPTLEEYLIARSNRLDSKEHPDVVLFTLGSYDKTLARELNDEGSKAWPVLIKSLGLCYEDGLFCLRKVFSSSTNIVTTRSLSFLEEVDDYSTTRYLLCVSIWKAPI